MPLGFTPAARIAQKSTFSLKRGILLVLPFGNKGLGACAGGKLALLKKPAQPSPPYTTSSKDGPLSASTICRIGLGGTLH